MSFGTPCLADLHPFRLQRAEEAYGFRGCSLRLVGIEMMAFTGRTALWCTRFAAGLTEGIGAGET